MNILVIIHNNFNETELVSTIAVLSKTNKCYFTYYNPDYKMITGSNNLVKIETINEISIDDYDAVFIPGGPGAQLLRHDSTSLSIIKKFKNKKIWAICDAPNVLYEHKIISDTQNYSSFPSIGENKSFDSCGKNRNDDYVSIDNSIFELITGKCAGASVDFGLKILEMNFDKETFEKIRYNFLTK
ncbi:glutamine amidotransferase [Mycoplasmopsis pullorum]|uniref:DJ-1/PfpI family protein n=1 Tax=Mycoplasmopsis pullorum TaxID=48003 RepID=UPI0011183481|nr:DJ-1/PfpI family protein [Mycoplasmopsis pullorum]TNK83784.1 glutamine amidotransferase [Mycoplasmopsis pullorum]TNK92034.1 glutamine amidotransferase [Mycoplasmopsis pullorum]